MTNPRFLEQLEDRIAALEHAFNYLAERFNGTLPGTRELPDVGVPVAQPDPYAHLKECLANGGEIEVFDGTFGTWSPRSIVDYGHQACCYRISKPAPVKEDKPPVAQPGKDDGAEVVWTDAALVEALRSFIEQDLGRPRNVRAPVGTVIAAYNIIKEERDDLRKKLAEAERERDAWEEKALSPNGNASAEHYARAEAKTHSQLVDANNEIIRLRDDLAKAVAERDAAKEMEEYHLKSVSDLAHQMVYKGNSVSWIYAKKDAYAHALDLAWKALASCGHSADGKTPLETAIGNLGKENATLKEALRSAEESLRDMTLMRDNANKIWKEYLGKLEAAEKELEIVKDGREAYRSGIDKMHVRLDNMEVENSRLFAFWECFRLSDLHERVLILNGSGSVVGGTLVADKWVAAKDGNA